MGYLSVSFLFAIALVTAVAAIVAVAAGMLAQMNGSDVTSVVTRGAVAFAGALTLLLAILTVAASFTIR
jgi:hypothetical protein